MREKKTPPIRVSLSAGGFPPGAFLLDFALLFPSAHTLQNDRPRHLPHFMALEEAW
jgi:hypothetical protein